MKERIIMSNIHLLESDWDKLMEKTGTYHKQTAALKVINDYLEEKTDEKQAVFLEGKRYENKQ